MATRLLRQKFILVLILCAGGYLLVDGEIGPRPSLSQEQKTFYCPMHPAFTSSRPGSCGICGMDLIPAQTPSVEHRLHRPEEHRATEAPDGYSALNLTKQEQDLMGVELIAAKLAPLEKTIKTVGRVDYDQTRLYHIHTKFEGYIEDLYVDFTGQFVEKGRPLFSVYSPELLATQTQYLSTLQAHRAKRGGLIDADFALSARSRLLRWDIDLSDIKQIEESGKPMRAMPIRSPVSGFVTAKTALQGMRVTPADSVYDLADLSFIWVFADFYEVDAPFVKVGNQAEFSLDSIPGRNFTAEIVYVYPFLNETTRTLQARLELANPDGALKPGMFGSLSMKAGLGRGIVVPESAVLATGARKIIFVEKEIGKLEPREVVAGVRLGGLWEIKSGVSSGEKVAAAGNFLLDSESRLKALLTGASRNEHRH